MEKKKLSERARVALLHIGSGEPSEYIATEIGISLLYQHGGQYIEGNITKSRSVEIVTDLDRVAEYTDNSLNRGKCPDLSKLLNL